MKMPLSLLRSLTRGLRVLTRGSAADRELDEEVRHFYDEAVADQIARGVAADEARRRTRLAFGDGTAVREEVRAHAWEHTVETSITDLRYAARGMRRQPGFTLVAVLTLALGIGASAAIFGAVDPILFEPLPYPHADRIVSIADRGQADQPVHVTYGTYIELAQRSRSFSALAIADRWQPSLMNVELPERLAGDRVTADYFRVLGVAPLIGRDLSASDDQTGAAPVAIVSDGFARRQFGTAPAALGRTITLDGNPFAVIGVMPQTFDNVLQPATDVWAPRHYRARAPFESAEWGHHLRMAGRLAPGVSLEQARTEMAEIARTPSSSFPRPPWASLKNGLLVTSLQASIVTDVRPALLAIFAAVGLVLIVASANVANLLLARGAARRGEFALRSALGAGRARVVRQLLTESLLLSFIGGTLGLAVAAVGIRALIAVAPAALPRAAAIRLDTTVFTFAVLITAIVGVAVGVYPALQSARSETASGLQPGTRIAGASHVLRRVLVVAEIALALMLLVGAGLMIRSLWRVMSVPPGFDPSHLLTVEVDAAGPAYNLDAARYQFFDQALEAVRGLPGVESVASSNQLPLGGEPNEGYGVHFEAQKSSDPDGDFDGLRYSVTPDWFRTMRIPLERGRLLTAADRVGEQESIVISESLAREAFPRKDPIGQRLRIGPEIGETHSWDVVVGVVGDVKQSSLSVDNDSAAFYVAMGQWPWVDNVQTIVVRTTGDPEALIPSVKQAIRSVDRNQPIIRVATEEMLFARSEAERRFVLMVFAAFGLAAVALAAIGIYGMVSGGVTERLTEIGVRVALGATSVNILLMVLRQGLLLAAAGVVLGVIGASLLTGMLRTLIYSISRGDVATYLASGAVVLAIAVAASAMPALRATRVNASTALRA